MQIIKKGLNAITSLKITFEKEEGFILAIHGHWLFHLYVSIKKKGLVTFYLKYVDF